MDASHLLPLPLAVLSFERVSVATVVFAVAVVGIAFAIGYWLVSRRRTKQHVNEQSDSERIHQRETDRQTGVPLRSRAWGVPTEAKWLAAVAGVVAFYISFQVYTYLRTGSPTQTLYTIEAQMATATLVGGAVLVRLHKYVGGKYGRLEVLVESPPDEEDARVSTEHMTIYFHVDDIVETEQGRAVNRYSDSRFLFFFRLPMRHAEVPFLRDNDQVMAPPEDKVTVAIPDNAYEIQQNVYTFRTKGRTESKSPDTEIDVQWRPPFSVSYEEKKRREQDREKILTDIREVKATNARLTQQVIHLEEALAAALEENWEQFMELAEEFHGLFDGTASGRGDQVSVPRSVLQQMTDGRSERGNGAYADAGDTTHSEAATSGRRGDRR